MKKITLLFFIILNFPSKSFAQTNPVTELSWTHYYTFMQNWFDLNWQEPATPHDELVGYNVYRGDEFYRFQTETSLNRLPIGENCGEDFLYYNDGNGFLAHVTAVYANGLESDYIETIAIDGPLLNVSQFDNTKVTAYPNPTNGILHIGNQNLTKIAVFDLSGKKLKEWNPETEIDLSDFAKGVYLITLFSDNGNLTDKIVVK